MLWRQQQQMQQRRRTRDIRAPSTLSLIVILLATMLGVVTPTLTTATTTSFPLPDSFNLTSATTDATDSADAPPPVLISGFPALWNATVNAWTCPDSLVHEVRNGFCWLKGSSPYLQFQNKFMDSYDADGKSGQLEPVDAYSVVITAWSGASTERTGNIPLPYLPIPISHDGPGPQRILIEGQGIRTLMPHERLNLTTNSVGKLLFAVVLDDKQFHKPLFRAYPPFTEEKREHLVFAVDSHAMHELSQISGQSLREKGVIGRDIDYETADSTATAIQHLLLPLLHGDFQEKLDREEERLSNHPLRKRSLKYQSRKFPNTPFHPQSNLVRSRLCKSQDPVKRLLSAHHMPNQHWELQFDHEFGTQFIPHTQKSLHLQKRAFHRTHERLYKRGNYLDKLKEFGGSLVNMTRAVFLDVPKSIFNRTAMKKGSSVYGSVVGDALFNVTQAAVDTTHDFIDILPYGKRINEKIGLDELADRIAVSRSILVTQAPNGMELVVVDKNNTVSHAIVSTVQQAFAVVQGLFHKIKVGFQKMIAYLKSVFEWNGILLNHRIISAHLMKMMPFVKAEVTSRKSNLSEDVSNMMQRINDYSEEAVKMVFTGNLSSLGGLLTEANKEIFKNITYNPDISRTDNENVPLDMQSTFFTDRIANANGTLVQVSEEDKESILALAKQAATAVGDLGQDSAEKIKEELHNLWAQIQNGTWDIGMILRTMGSLLSFGLRIMVEKLFQGLLVVFDVLLSLFDKILRAHIRLPFVTRFYEQVITRNGSRLSLYDVFSLTAAVPVTVAFRSSHNMQNLFTNEEAEILINTMNPEYYVDNLVAYGMLAPNRNATALRNMYRRSVSYILGAGFATSQMYSALVGPVGHGYLSLYFMRAPFELISIFCNYPWSWYTEAFTKVGLNIRFLSWFFQFLPLFIGWPLEDGSIQNTKWNIIGYLALFFGIVPNLVLIVRTWMQDISFLRGNVGLIEGANQLDITLKGIARMMIYAPRVFLMFHGGPGVWTAIFRLSILAGASLQNVRLFVDMPIGAIYSV